MKLVKNASGKQSIKISKKEWEEIGKKAGWLGGHPAVGESAVSRMAFDASYKAGSGNVIHSMKKQVKNPYELHSKMSQFHQMAEREERDPSRKALHQQAARAHANAAKHASTERQAQSYNPLRENREQENKREIEDIIFQLTRIEENMVGFGGLKSDISSLIAGYRSGYYNSAQLHENTIKILKQVPTDQLKDKYELRMAYNWFRNKYRSLS